MAWSNWVNCSSTKSQAGITSFFWSGTFHEFPKLAAYWERSPPIVVKSSWVRTKKMLILFVIANETPAQNCNKCKYWINARLPTISIVVVDSTQSPCGCQVFSCDSHVDGVAQVKLYSYAKAAFHKRKVSKPVNAHSFTKKTWSIQSVKLGDSLTEPFNVNKTYHSGKLALHLELKEC